ncbi:MAG: HD domain-containing protein [Pseudobdellovibrionaceae bacterium]
MARSSQGFSGSRHTFLESFTLSEAALRLKPPSEMPTGEVDEPLAWSASDVSQFLSQEILKKFRAHPQWQKAQPILLGSWGRGDLSAKSDLDLLFLGPHETVMQLVRDLQNEGLRIRYRVPENPKDWSAGVLSTDLLALWQAQAETPEANASLLEQQQKIFSNSKIKRKILKDLWKERKERARRLDSIQSFLEPQIKFGAGGLRDLFQGQVILHLFSEKFQDAGYERKVLEYYRHFFMTLRHWLHFHGFSDVLIASEQFELARWFGFDKHSEFMRQIQRGLARVHFYSDWILLQAQIPESQAKTLEKIKFKKPEDLLKLLQKNPSVLAQYKVRLSMNRFSYSSQTRARMLSQLFQKSTSDESLQAVFRSRLIDKLCPRISHLVGLVQHDQYHRFTADAHLLQACREVKRVEKSPQTLGALKAWALKLKNEDWKILAWSSLYHDIAKGLSGDHSEIGESWVRKDLKSFGFSKAFIDEVAWLVRNHLALSTAAFRKNPQSPRTWEELQELGLNERRLLRLAIWTALDIRATNPEAWNEWKARLLHQLVEKVLAGGTQTYLELKKKLPRGVSKEWIEGLDPHLFEIFSVKKLKEELQSSLDQDGSWAILKDSQKRNWLRYQQKEDRSGLLSELVEKIYASGASIQHALIHTLPQVGVYDWFQIQTAKDSQSLLKRLTQMKAAPVPLPAVQFLSIDLISETPHEWVISFRGVDQKGLLLTAVSKLKALGAEIRSARVHTWGRQIEDLFHIDPQNENFMQKLREGLLS